MPAAQSSTTPSAVHARTQPQLILRVSYSSSLVTSANLTIRGFRGEAVRQLLEIALGH